MRLCFNWHAGVLARIFSCISRRYLIKLTSPFTIFRDGLNSKILEIPTCFIDETEVVMDECAVQMEEKIEISKSNFWHEECEEHPINSNCKVFDE